MNTMATRSTSYFISGITLLLFSLWAYLTYPQALSDNNAVLIIYAERFLSGGQFGAEIFDTNPPLSILIYLPIALAHKYLNIPIHFANFVYPLLLLAVSLTIARKIILKSSLRNYSAFILCLFALGVTLSAPQSWGERDLLSFLGLFPYALLILVRTEKSETLSPKLTLWTCLFATTLILLKPHYGLLPLALFIHRWINTKSLKSVIYSYEFLVPVAGTVIYALSTFIFFSGYITDILPDTLTLYASEVIHPDTLIRLSLFIGVLTLVIWGTSETYFEKNKLKIVRFFAFATLATLGAFIAQSKGLFYHLIPAKTYFLIFCSLTLLFYLQNFLRLKPYAQMFVFILACSSFFLFFSPLYTFNSKEKIQELPFSQTLKKHCPTDRKCSAYIFHDAVNGVFTTFIYDDIDFASRFSSLWWLPKLYLSLKENNELENAGALRKKYTDYMAQDIELHKPDVLIILKDVKIYGHEGDYDFDFLDFFTENPNFKKAFSYYRLKENIRVDVGQYYSGTALGNKDERDYAVYVRNK